MSDWPAPPAADLEAVPEQRQHHRMDVFLKDGRPVDVRLDGATVWPTWFKLEFKETGELSAKVKGVRLATRYGDEITIHQG